MRIFTDAQPAQGAAQRISDLVAEHASRDVLLLLSGGSALAVLDFVDTTSFSDRVTLSVVDERYTFDDTASNFSQLINTAFFERARKQHVQVIDPRPAEGEDLLDTAKRFDVALKYWHITHHDGVVLALLGIGEDGHTAGILPLPNNPNTFKELFFNDERCVRGYHVNAQINPHQDRLTIIASYIKRHIDYAVVYLVGAKKHAALSAFIAPEGELSVTPARILLSLQQVDIYTDIDVTVDN